MATFKVAIRYFSSPQQAALSFRPNWRISHYLPAIAALDLLPSVIFAIRNPQFTIDNSQGGIAQLVERQLCKLEVRGSNPLASKA
jgi:hypothetical protein